MKAKRTIAGVLALSVLATAAASISAVAVDGTVTLSASTAQAVAGGTFTVDVSLADIPSSKVNVLDFALTFDSSALTVTDVTIGDSANTDVSEDTTATDAPVFSTNIQDGEIDVSWTTGLASDAWISTDGVILTITGTVNADTADGTYPIAFAPVSRESYEGSGVSNTAIIVGYIYGTDTTQYEVVTEDGAVVVGDTVTTTTTTVDAGSTETTTVSTTDGGTTETSEVTGNSSTDATTGASETTTQAVTTAVAVDANALYGDANVDSLVNLADSVTLNKSVAGLVTLSDQGRANSDLNLDSYVDADDALIMLKYQVSLITKLPYTGE